MRFFKYLVFIFFSIVSFQTFAADGYDSYVMDGIIGVFATPERTCKAKLDKYKSERSDAANWSINAAALPARCQINGGGFWVFDAAIRKIQTSCPVDYPLILDLPKSSTYTPTTRCLGGCTYVMSGTPIVDYPTVRRAIMRSTGSTANCTDTNSDDPKPACDPKDPYGKCYSPDDKCIRESDGSIVCPNNENPPTQQGCENGAMYCKRPPGGCGPDYVPGSFNGEQLCVKKGPDKPDEPDEPDNPPDNNQCKNGEAYCNKPNDKQCPSGYYQSFYQGKAICVKDNPNPEQPNQNDPNNNPNAGDGDGNGNGDGNGDGENEGGASHAAGSCNGTNNCNVTNNKIDVKSILNAIAALRDALLQALSSIKDTLVDGFKKLTDSQDKTNEKLDKTNEHLEKSNEHLEKIEESTGAASETLGDIKDLLGDNAQAASEAAAQTNEKLDGIKDAIEGMYKCENQRHNANDPASKKYRSCDESDLPFSDPSSSSDTNIDIGDISVGEYESDYVSWSAQCPPDNHVNINLMGQSSTLVLSWSPWCELLSKIRWAIIACAYFAAAYIILGMR